MRGVEDSIDHLSMQRSNLFVCRLLIGAPVCVQKHHDRLEDIGDKRNERGGTYDLTERTSESLLQRLEASVTCSSLRRALITQRVSERRE